MRRERAALDDIIEYARQACESLESVSRPEFKASLEKQNAVIRCVIVVGEAANRLPKETKSALAGIRWSDIRNMRNILVPEYDNVELDALFDTVLRDFPPLITIVRTFLNSMEP